MVTDRSIEVKPADSKVTSEQTEVVAVHRRPFTVIENIKGQRVPLTPPAYVDDEAINLPANAVKVLEKRYLRRDLDGTLLETPAGMFYRLAYHIAQVEEQHAGDTEAMAKVFYDLLTERRFYPNSPTFTGAGTPLGQLAACFVLPIEDDMGKAGDGIFSTLRVAALIQQTGGGNGFSFSRLRPKNDVVHTSSGRATGPVGFLRVYDQAFGEIAQGGCLLPDTLVFTERGLMRLDEIVDVNQPGWQPHRLAMATDDGWRTSQQGYNNGVAPVLRVHTREGLSLAGTAEHRVKVMTDNGPEWRCLQDLQPGDWVMVGLGQHRGSHQALRHPQRQHGNQNWPTLPRLLDEEFAFFLGYLAGDGFVAAQPDDHRLGVSVAHSSYLMEEMPALLARLFGVTVHTQQKVNDRSVTFVIDNRAVKDFLQLNGLDKLRSRHVSVPRLIRQSPPEIVGAYLRGLFEADGSLSHGYPSLMTTSARLAEEVAVLLTGLGAPISVRSLAAGIHKFGTATVYQVRIQSTVGLQVWRERIGCDPRSRFVAAHAWESDERRESAFVLPAPAYWLQPVVDAITLEQVDRQKRGMGINFRSSEPRLRRTLLRYLRGDRQLTRSGYEELRRVFPEFAEHVRSPDGLWFVKVSGVEPIGEALTLDLEVDDNHTYLANGMVTHNSRRGANMGVLRIDHPDIEDFIVCKAEEGTIANFNISVAITDEFMQCLQNDGDFALRNPRDGSVWRTVPARDLFNKIVKYAHRNGEPGILFIDAANRSNPVPHLYDLEATNPCVTGDSLIYTQNGLLRAQALYDSQIATNVVLDSRFGADTDFSPVSSPVFYTGIKPVYSIQTKEGYTLKATSNHRIMTTSGWVTVEELTRGDKVHILNHKGGFGKTGSLALGRTIGWLYGDGPLNIAEGAGLMFLGEEQDLAPMFADHANEVVGVHEHNNVYAPTRQYRIGVQSVAGRNESRVISTRLKTRLSDLGIRNKEIVPDVVFTGSEEMQRGFLQGLFAADGTVLDKVDKGVSVRLWSNKAALLTGVQQLLLNFGIVSKIYLNRKKAHHKLMPDGQGGQRAYFTQAGHELTISKNNLGRFQQEIGFLQQAKSAKLADALQNYGNRGSYTEYFTATVESVTLLGEEPVYDLTEPLTHSFVANGFVVHNCGEQWLGPYENCCLGSINLAVHTTHDADGKAQVDWDLLRRSVYESTCFLDNVVTANAYVPVVPEVAAAAFRARRIGLGIMGLGDMMYHLGIRYGSEEGQEFAAQVMEFVRFHCMDQSIVLAKARQPFLAFAGSIYDANQPHPEGTRMQWQPPQAITPFARDWGRPALDWQDIVTGIKQYGIRNAAQTTVAPTGTIATVCGCEGYGCEPVFALGYIRHFKDGDRDVELAYTSPLFDQALSATDLSDESKQAIKQHVATYGSCQDVLELPDEIRHAFVVSSDISAEEHVRMQAAIQAFVDNSISKTCNFAEGATEADVAQAYLLAWELGCKGLTVYVTGSRQQVVLETKATRGKKDQGTTESEQPAAVADASARQQPLSVTSHALASGQTNGQSNGRVGAYEGKPIVMKRPRPNRLRGMTYRKETPLGKAYITVNSDDRGEPFEVFLNVGKAGSEVSAVSEAIGRLVSLVLRMPGSLPPSERLHWVVDEIADIGGGRPMGFGAKRVRSLPDGIAQVLAEHLSELPVAREEIQAEQLALPIAQRPIGDMCPECGEATLLNVEGCRKCQACGYSEC